MKKAILISALILAPLTAAHADLITLPNEPDVCSNIEGYQYPAPSGWHAEADGTCTELQAPVTIDVVAPGEDPQTIDVNTGGGAQTIDVNPAIGGSSGSSSGRPNYSSDGQVLGVSTPSVITSVAELQNYVFDPNTTTEERVSILQVRLIQVLTALVQQLQTQLTAQ